MPEQQKPRRYIIQKHVMACSVQEALKQEAKTPVTSVFPDDKQPEEHQKADCIGFRNVTAEFPYEY